MDRDDLARVLGEVDRRLSASCDIAIVGGAAMILHFGARRATRDVDMLLLRGDTTELRQAIEAVAQRNDLPEDWMSDAAKGFADILPSDFYHRLTPLELPLQRLRVYALGCPEQTAMKIVALREQDLEDLELLLPQLSESDKRTLVAIMNHVSGFRMDWAQRIKYFLEEQGWPTE
ncbi:MAG: hypothetical protein CVU38_10320 [Chloroflexi bacterium HGW-Chloroflexi-1]|nr:MAG: hypothetical protein CVU38_10320 [Chloroflexi bacterium HGW-Chloroflexi-1]